MEDDRFQVERIGPVARCTMNLPEKMNALCPAMCLPMLAAMPLLLEDPAVGAVVLRGAGGNFSVGADFDLIGDHLDPLRLRGFMLRMNAFLSALYHGPKPVIAQVDGFAVGGGLGLALASDLTVASERARFCAGFIRIGAVPDLGTAYFLTERLGLIRAKALALTGDIIDAAEALRIGLVNQVVHPEALDDTAMTLAQKIARHDADALSWTKRCLNQARHRDLQTVMDLEAHIQPLMLSTEAHRSALKRLFAGPSPDGQEI